MDKKPPYLQSLKTLSFLFISMCVSLNAYAGGMVVNPDPFEIPEGLYQANYLRDVNGVSVIQFSGDYDRTLNDGQFNSAARAVVAQEFYANNPDNYDFLVVYTDFEFETGDALAFHIGVANDVEGIGLPVYSNRELFGSTSELGGYIDMASIDRYQTNPLSSIQLNQQSTFSQGLRTLAHETLHQWGIFSEIEDFQGRQNAHWNFFMHTDASVEYGHNWLDNGDGTFTAESSRVGYSKFDLYLMGLASADEVPDTFVITPDNDDYNRNDIPTRGITVSGTRTDYTLQDYIDVHGERVPSVEDSPKVFRYAFIYLTADGGTVNEVNVERINTVRRAYEDRFAILTQGRAIARVQPSVRVETSAGEFDTVDSEQEELNDVVDINLALSWLESRQEENGFWQDMPATAIRDTVTVAQVLEDYANVGNAVDRSEVWLADQNPQNTDSLARILRAVIVPSGAQNLLALQREDGGWSLSEAYQSSVIDTSLAICALVESGGNVGADRLNTASQFLESRQNVDGGWSSVESANSTVNATTHALEALSCLRAESQVVDEGLAWFASQVRDDGGFGDVESTVHETARVLKTLLLFDSISSIPFAEAAGFIAEGQSIDGDWNGSVYTTALAVDALQSLNFPNLVVASITAGDPPIRDGEFVTLTAVIENDSTRSIPESTVQFSILNTDQTQSIIESITLPFLPPFSSATVTAPWNTFGRNGTQTIQVFADPSNSLVERIESDNQLTTSIEIQAAVQGPELSVSSAEFAVTPDRVDRLPIDLSFAATVRNIGNESANNVLVELLLERPNAEDGTAQEPELLQSTRLDLPARASNGVNFTLANERAGDQTFILRVDSEQSVDELIETNNQATVSVSSVDSADLSVSAADISLAPSTLFLNQNGVFTVQVRNTGTSTVSNANILVTVQNQSGDTTILDTAVTFAPGEQREITASWLADFDGQSTVLVELDSQNLVAEVNEDNNQASFAITTNLAQGVNLSVNSRDIAFNPNPGFEGMSAALSAVVRNNGTQAVSTATVEFYDGNPDAGGVLIADTSVLNLAAGASATAQVIWPRVDGANDRFVYVVVSSQNQELDEQDNTAFEEFKVVSLPDFAISQNSIQSQPRFPRASESATYRVLITNRGMQAGENITVVARVGNVDGAEIATTNLNIPASGDTVWEFEHVFSEIGEPSVFISVDPDNQVFESDEANNTATRSVLVQDGDFFVSSLYLSPNGDDINETVDYTFTLESPANVSVVILDRRDNIVREYDFDGQAVSSERVTWDGINSNGGRAADATYRFAVREASGNVIGERAVTIDTNRSALSEAIGTRFSLTRNLSCQIGEIADITSIARFNTLDRLIYGPNDEYFYFTTYFDEFTDAEGNLVVTDENTLYPTGLYRSSIDGREIIQLIDNNALSIEQISDIAVSPNGQRLALVYDRNTGQTSSDIWVLDNDGENLFSLDVFASMDSFRGSGEIDFQVQFQDNETILYPASRTVGEGESAPVIQQIRAVGNAQPRNFIGFGQNAGLRGSVVLDPQGKNVLNLQGDFFFNDFGTVLSSAYDLAGDVNRLNANFFSAEDGSLVFDLQNIDSIEYDPIGNIIAVGNSKHKAIDLLSARSFDVVQKLNFGQQQAEQFTQEEQLLLSEYIRSRMEFFDGVIVEERPALITSSRTVSSDGSVPDNRVTSGISSNLFDGLVGRVSQIEWNPDASEFAFVFEDYLAAIAKSDGCVFSPAIFGSTTKKNSLLNIALNAFISDAHAGGGFSPVCNIQVPERIRELLDRYQTLDGIYIARLADSSIEQAAAASTINASFANFFGGVNFGLLDDLAPETRLSQNELSTRLNALGFPVTPNDLPYIEWAGVSAVYNYPEPSLRTMHWLTGARELLITNGDESQYYDRFEPSNFRTDPEELNPLDLAANNSVLLNLDNPSQDTMEVFSNRDLITYRRDVRERAIRPSHTGDLLLFQSEDDIDACPLNRQTIGFRQFQSLLNLTADLRVRRAAGQGAFILEGSAVDKHMDLYQLEYADIEQPDVWISIQPAQNAELIDGQFTTWVAPYIGDFLVRLTVTDRAGNSRQRIRRVNNREQASISGLFITESHFSPNGDGVKDTTALNFRVLRNVNLDFQVFDENDNLVRSEQASFDVIGSQQSFEWNGRDNSARLVSDGAYRISVQGLDFFVVLDTTPPLIVDTTTELFVPQNNERLTEPCDLRGESDPDVAATKARSCFVSLQSQISATLQETFLDTLVLQERLIGASEWEVSRQEIESTILNEELNIELIALERGSLPLELWKTTKYRFRAEDLSGNVSILEIGEQKRNKAHVTRLSELSDRRNLDINNFGYATHPGFGVLADYRSRRSGVPTITLLRVINSVVGDVQFAEFLYRDASRDGDDFFSLSVDAENFLGEGGASFDYLYDLKNLIEIASNQVEFYFRLRTFDGAVIETDRVIFTHNLEFFTMPSLRCSPFSSLDCPPDPAFPLTFNDLTRQDNDTSDMPFPAVDFGINFPSENVDRIVVFLQSNGELEDSRYIENDVLEVSERTIDPVTGKITDTTRRFTDLGTIILDDNDPGFTLGRTLDESIYRLFAPEIQTIASCGYGYRLTALAFHNGELAPLSTGFRSQERCLEIQSQIKSVEVLECGDGPSNEVNIGLLPAFTGGQASDAGEVFTPLFLQVGIQEPGSENLSTILFNQNFPEINRRLPNFVDFRYGFNLDTSPYPEGFLNLTAVLALEDGTRVTSLIRIPIVHSFPSVDITFPQDGDRVCTVPYEVNTRVGPKEVQGIEVQGSASTVGPDLRLEVNQLTLRNQVTVDETFLGSNNNRNTSFSLSREDNPTIGIEGKRRVADGVFVNTAPFRFSPITGRLTNSGVLAIPVLDSNGLQTLEFEAVNWGSARQCQSITIDADVNVEGVVINPEGGVVVGHRPYASQRIRTFSPNNDDVFDTVNFNYAVNEAVTVDLDVRSTEFTRQSGSQGSITIGDMVAQPVIGAQVTNGDAVFEWDGVGADGDVLSDGVYQVSIQSRDGCDHLDIQKFLIVIDTTAPSVAITEPVAGSNIALQPRVFGRATDLHPEQYELFLSANGGDFTRINTGVFPVDLSNVSNPLGIELGQLSLFAQTGLRTLRLQARDIVGNTAVTEESFQIPDRLDLITSLETTEYFVSPNNDQRLDTLTIRVGFNIDVSASIAIRGAGQQLIRNLSVDTPYQAGLITLIWDGLDEQGQVATDGVYQVGVVAEGAGNVQQETVAFELDNTPPNVELFNVVDGFVELRGQDDLFGAVSDRNFQDYLLELIPSVDSAGIALNRVQVAESSSAQAGVLGTIPAELRDAQAEFQVSLLARDLAGNRSNVIQNVVLDQTPPEVEIAEPEEGLIVNLEASPLLLTGRVEDNFLSNYQIFLRPSAPGANLSDGTEIFLGTSNVDGPITGINLEGLEDGPYTVTIIATDRGGLTANDSVEFVVDNTPPEVNIQRPLQDTFVTAVETVLGTANDAHFSQYELGIAEGHVAEGGVYQNLTTSSRAVTAGSLLAWSELPSDGQYTFELRAEDLAGNEAVHYQRFTVDTTPPSAPILTSVEFADPDAGDVDIVWEPNTENDLAGYILFRDGGRVSGDLIVPSEFLDLAVTEGEHTYQVKAVDLAGLESEFSNSLSILFDRTPPEVNISRPLDGSRVTLLVDIIGTAFSETDFRRYRLFIGQQGTELSLVHESPLATQNDLLFQWDTITLLNDVAYTIRLEAEDTNGNSASDQVTVTVDSEAPIAPENLVATIINTNDAEVTWEYTGDRDELIGFLLFRDGQVVNSNGPVIGSLEPFAIDGLRYLDLNLTDGEYEYQVFALDLAGNMSEGSNTDSVALDLRPPQAEYINIEPGQAFDESLYLLADTPDNDVAEIIMQYRPDGTLDWLDITTVTNRPYEFTWVTDTLDDGVYELRAVATDTSGNTDPDPVITFVEKRDILPPSQVLELSVRVDQDTATLTWAANTEEDLDGYRVFRHDCRECEPRERVANTGVNADAGSNTETYDDIESAHFEYFYSVAAIDEAGNVGQASELVSAVFTEANLNLNLTDVPEPGELEEAGSQRSPLIFPEPEKDLEISVPFIFDAGRRSSRQLTIAQAVSNITDTSGSTNAIESVLNPEAEFAVQRLTFDEIGVYGVSANVMSEENRFSTIQREPLVLVYQGQPSAPTDLEARANEETNTTNLTWAANPNEELVEAYRVIKNGSSINRSQLINDASAFSESGGPINNILPTSSFSSIWSSSALGRGFGQRWQRPRLVTAVNLSWNSSFNSARDFDVFALLNGELVQIDSQSNRRSSFYNLSLPNAILTTEIRIVVNEYNSRFGGQLRRMSIFGEDLFQIADFYSEAYDGQNSDFSLQAINTYGGVSVPSDPVELLVGDGNPPPTVVLSASVDPGDPVTANLSWTTSEGADRYRVFQDGVFIVETPNLNTDVLDLANGTYQYYVVAVDASGAESAISNIEEVIINIPLLSNPINLSAMANNDAQVINLSWQFDADSQSLLFDTLYGYNVYRSEAPFTDIDADEVELVGESVETQFIDISVVPNRRYFYRVTAVSDLGNESLPSNEADAELLATGYLGRVNLTMPTDETEPFITVDSHEDVGGIAPAGANVFLLQDDDFLPTSVAASRDAVEVDLIAGLRSIDDAPRVELSAFTVDSQGQHLAVWGDQFDFQSLYQFVDGQWRQIPIGNVDRRIDQIIKLENNRILVTLRSSDEAIFVDLNTEQVTRSRLSGLERVASVNRVLSYSEELQLAVVDGFVFTDQGAFVSGLFKVFLDTREFELLPAADSQLFSISPSGQYYAYIANDGTDTRLRVENLLGVENSSVILPDVRGIEAAFDNFAPWSPDETKLLVVHNREQGPSSTIQVTSAFNVASGVLNDVATSNGQSSRAVWASNNAIFHYDPTSLGSLLINPIDPADPIGPIGPQIERIDIRTGISENVILLPDSYTGPNQLVGFSQPGSFIFSNGELQTRSESFSQYSLAGVFTFENVTLNEGSNRFSAVAVDSEGNVTVPSAEIEVIRENVNLPDYSVEVTVTPLLPIVDADANLEILVRNDSQWPAEQTNLVVRAIDTNGQSLTLADQRVGPLTAQSDISVDVPWRPTQEGSYSIIVEVDQASIIEESDETNNLRIVPVDVFADRAPVVENQLGLSSSGNTTFDISETVLGSVRLRNSGSAISGNLVVDVIDPNGVVVAIIDQIEINQLANGAEFNKDYQWSPSGTALGDYFTRARFLDTVNQPVSSDQDAFDLVEQLSVILGVRANQFSYSSNEDVTITATSINRSEVISLENADLRIEIRSSAGDLLFSEERAVESVLAGDRSAATFSWNTGAQAPGPIQINAVLAQQGNELTRASTGIEIRPGAFILSGDLSLEDTELGLDQPLVFAGLVSNQGNLTLDAFTVRYLVRDENGVVRSLNQPTSALAPQAQSVTTQSIDTINLAPGRYRLLMQAELIDVSNEVSTIILDDEGFSIIENRAPTVLIQQPSEGEIFNSEGRRAVIFARDDSVVTRVDARFTNNEWLGVESDAFEQSRYSVALSDLSDGPQVLAVRAVDDQENESSIRRRRFVIDNTPPEIVFENINEGVTFTEAITPQVSVNDANLDTQAFDLNGNLVTDFTEITVNGSYVLRVTATDLAGNSSESEVSFSIDINTQRPLNAVDDDLPVSRGVFATINLLANDSFNNLDDLTVEILRSPTRGRLVRASNGVYNYSPTLLALGLDSFTYRLTDTRTGETSDATVRVDISPVASCSFVPDHSTRTDEGVVLINWARNSEDLDEAPRFQINILGSSDDSAFVAGQTPRISFPECSLSYTARSNVRGRVTVRYSVTDVATGGQRYTSPIREFTLDINTSLFSESVFVPILQLLLFENENQDAQ